MNLPFNLRMGNTVYNNVYVGSNGTIMFGVNEGQNYYSTPTAPSISVAGYDWTTWSNGSGVTYSTTTNTLTVAWDVRPYPQMTADTQMTQIRFNADVNPTDGAWVADVSVTGPIPNGARFNTRSTTNGTITPITDTNSGPGFNGTISQGASFTPTPDPSTAAIQSAIDTANAQIATLNSTITTVVAANTTNTNTVIAPIARVSQNTVTALTTANTTLTAKVADLAIVSTAVQTVVAAPAVIAEAQTTIDAETARLAAIAAEAARVAAEAARVAAEADAALAAQQAADAQARAERAQALAEQAAKEKAAAEATAAAQQAANEKAAAEAKAAEDARIAAEQAAKEAQAAADKAAEDAKIQAAKDAQAAADAAKAEADAKEKAAQDAQAAADAAKAEADAKEKAAQDAALAEQKAKDEAAQKAQQEANAKAEADKAKAEADKIAADQAAKDQAAKDAKAQADAAIQAQKDAQAKADAQKAADDKAKQDAIGVKPNSPDQLSDTVVKEAPKEVLVPHIQQDKPGIENGGIEFFGTKTAPQVVGEDGKITPPAPPPGSGLPIPADAITTQDTFIGQPGGTTFNAPDIAVPVIETPVTGTLAIVPGVQALNHAFVAMSNIGNDMSPVTRKKAKKILVLTVVVTAIRRRFTS